MTRRFESDCKVSTSTFPRWRAPEELDHYLDALDIVTSAGNVHNIRPSPDLFTARKKVAALPADEVIVGGGASHDGEAGAKCGNATIAFRSGEFSDVAALPVGHDASPLAR